MLTRRQFLAAGAAATAVTASAALPPAKITRIRIYQPPNLNQLFNQSNMVCTVETDAGITGVGEGGAKDTLEQCAGSLIGKNPFQIETLWQTMYMEWFYPPGREKIHALGALDLALWDIKGKALKLPIHQMLNGATREYMECYPTGGAGRPGMSLKERAAATMAAGYRVFRTGGGDVRGDLFDVRAQVRLIAKACEEIREGVGDAGNWAIDLHQRFDYADALRLCRLMEKSEPFFVEDPTRAEQFLDDIPKLRAMTSCPLTAGEEWGQRWDFNKLIEHHDVDFIRATLPNVGGLTEMMKVLALCETHAVGIVPHFTGPIATAALANCLAPFPGPVLFEYNYGERPIDYLPECLNFKQGKLYTNDRPGLGVTLDMKLLKQIGEVTTPVKRNIYKRPDGSLTHW